MLADFSRSLKSDELSGREIARAAGAVVRYLPALTRWLRSLPSVELTLSDSHAGRDIRRALVDDHSWVSRRRAVAVLILPADFASYLSGRSRQAVRTNRRRALILGFGATASSDSGGPRDLMTDLVTRYDDGTTRQLARHAVEGTAALWFVTERDGRCIAAASVLIDGPVARLDTLYVAPDCADRSAARYLLSTEIIEALIGSGVRYLLADSLLFAPDGLVYLQERLGFRAMNLTFSPRLRARRR